jgi:GABA permease
LKNPFRTEAAAFHFLWGTIGYFGLIAIASLINTWAGVVVFVLETGVLIGWWLTTRGDSEAPEKQAPPPHPPGEKRLLVIANETVGGPELLAELERHARGRQTDVLVVTPALNSPLRHWVSDEDAAREAAAARLEASLETMRAAGMNAHGEVGDSDPVQAIEDAIRTFAPDEIVISTHPEGRSNWLERGVVGSAKERFAVPVTHVVVDLEAEPEAAGVESASSAPGLSRS